MRPRFDAVVFDMDGTLFDTLEGLTDAVNHMRSLFGGHALSSETVRAMLGNGLWRLLADALPAHEHTPGFEQAFDEFRSYYIAHCEEGTCAYPGIEELAGDLLSAGLKLAVVTNKVQAAADALVARLLPGRFSAVLGSGPDVPLKPDPAGLLGILDELGVERSRAVYVGDSEVDLELARAAGTDCLLVSWGFRDRDRLSALGGGHIVDAPGEIARYVLG